MDRDNTVNMNINNWGGTGLENSLCEDQSEMFCLHDFKVTDSRKYVVFVCNAREREGFGVAKSAFWMLPFSLSCGNNTFRQPSPPSTSCPLPSTPQDACSRSVGGLIITHTATSSKMLVWHVPKATLPSKLPSTTIQYAHGNTVIGI